MTEDAGPEIDPEMEAAVAARIARFDQEEAAWVCEAIKLATYYRTLHEGGVPKDLAKMMTLNAQANHYEGGPVIPDECEYDEDEE
jgi:hypothetical protein